MLKRAIVLILTLAMLITSSGMATFAESIPEGAANDETAVTEQAADEATGDEVTEDAAPAEEPVATEEAAQAEEPEAKEEASPKAEPAAEKTGDAVYHRARALQQIYDAGRGKPSYAVYAQCSERKKGA